VMRDNFTKTLGNYYDAEEDDIGGVCWKKDDSKNGAEEKDESYFCFKNLKP